MSDEEETIPLEADDDKPLPLEDDEPLTIEAGPAAAEGPTKIQAFGAFAAGAETKQAFKRPLNLTGAGATRVRLFHSKIALTPLDHMIQTINEWLDGEQIEVKCIHQVIGTMEGKRPEPNVIITVWY